MLLTCFGLASMANLSSAQGLISGGFLFFSLRLLSLERRLVLSQGVLWRGIHIFTWVVLLLMLFFQAPLIPATCAAVISKSENVGVPWCTLLMSTAGLFKMNSDLTTDECDAESHTVYCAGSMSGILKTVAIWLLVDLQSRLFRHPLYEREVRQWHRRRELRGRVVALMTAERAVRLRVLHARRQQVWQSMSARKLADIVSKLEAIEALIRGATEQTSAAPADSLRSPRPGAYEPEAMRSGVFSSMHSSAPDAPQMATKVFEHLQRQQFEDGLMHACRQLRDVGFDAAAAHSALLRCGVERNGQPRVSSYILLRAVPTPGTHTADAARASR